MQFTLKLNDYIDQYKQNLEDGSIHCPVCYEEIMEGNTTKDVTHLLQCYKIQVIELTLIRYFDNNGFYPEIDNMFVETINRDVENEIINISQQLLK